MTLWCGIVYIALISSSYNLFITSSSLEFVGEYMIITYVAPWSFFHTGVVISVLCPLLLYYYYTIST